MSLLRFCRYCGAIVKHFYLISAAVFLTFVSFIESFITNPVTRKRFEAWVAPLTWTKWSALAFVFLATFRAWKEENDKRLELEKGSPEALRVEVAELRANLKHTQRREVTPEQGVIMFNQVNSEAEEYAKQIYGYSAGFLHFLPTNDVPMQLERVFVRIKNMTAIPEYVRQLSDALNAAGIEHRIVARTDWRYPGTPRDDYCDLTVGRKKSS